MEPFLDALFRLYVFSTGRRLFALHQVRKLALAGGHMDELMAASGAATPEAAFLALVRREVAA